MLLFLHDSKSYSYHQSIKVIQSLQSHFDHKRRALTVSLVKPPLNSTRQQITCDEWGNLQMTKMTQSIAQSIGSLLRLTLKLAIWADNPLNLNLHVNKKKIVLVCLFSALLAKCLEEEDCFAPKIEKKSKPECFAGAKKTCFYV